MCVLLFDVFNGCSTSIKEKWVNMERNVKHLLLGKTDFKISIFSERKFEEMH